MFVPFQGVLASPLSAFSPVQSAGEERARYLSGFQMIKYSDFSSLWPVRLLNLARLQKGWAAIRAGTALSGLGQDYQGWEKGFSAGLLQIGYVQFNLDWAERRGAVIDIPKSLLVKLENWNCFLDSWSHHPLCWKQNSHQSGKNASITWPLSVGFFLGGWPVPLITQLILHVDEMQQERVLCKWKHRIGAFKLHLYFPVHSGT